MRERNEIGIETLEVDKLKSDLKEIESGIDFLTKKKRNTEQLLQLKERTKAVLFQSPDFFLKADHEQSLEEHTNWSDIQQDIEQKRTREEAVCEKINIINEVL